MASPAGGDPDDPINPDGGDTTPILNDDTFNTSVNVALSISPLTNDDYIPPGAIGSFTQPTNGSVDRDQSGLFYTPKADFCGTDTFNYTIFDSTTTYSATATVTINVACPPSTSPTSAPTASPTKSLLPATVDTILTAAPTASPTKSPLPASADPILIDDEAMTEENVAVAIPVLDNDPFIPLSKFLPIAYLCLSLSATVLPSPGKKSNSNLIATKTLAAAAPTLCL